MKRTLGLACALWLAAHGAARAAPPSGAKPPSPRVKAVDACLEAAEAGQSLRTEGKLLASRDALVRCVQPSCPAMVIQDCDTWKRQVEDAIPSVVLRAVEAGVPLAGVTLLLDGRPVPELRGQAFELDPGTHRARARAEDGREVEREIVVEIGVKHRVIELAFVPRVAPREPPKERAPRSLTGPLVLGGVGLVAVGVFGAMALSADADYRELERTCGTACGRSDVDDLRSRYLVGDAFLVGGVLALAGAAVWWLAGSSSAAP